jgi:predicted amidophosphoribosyltransferase
VVDVGDGRVLRTWYSLRYQNTVRTVLVAFKDEGRTDVASALAEAMVPAVRAALRSIADGHTIRLATIPSTRAALRRRGYRPIELVLAHAGLQASRPLRAARQTADQAGLGLVERRTNRRESLSARRDVSGQTFLLIDDIVTTGATLREARRAIEAGGGRVIGAVAIAHTERRMPRS